METKPLNINITQGGEEIIKNNPTSNTFKDYIIKNNQDLNQENKDLQLKIKDLENELSSKEDENDKYDERIRYMKGLLVNLHEIKNYALKIKDHQKELVGKYKQMTNRLIKNDKDVSNFFVNYFWSVWVIMILDVLFFQFYLNTSILTNIKCILFHLIPFLSLSFIYGFLTKKERFSFLVNLKKNKLGNGINYDIMVLNNYQNDVESKIDLLSKDLKKTEEACIGIDIMIDNL